ncbi:MAG: hypothetical protein QXY75_06125, partial [Candidatus Bathyarchaeia archaeon]
RILAKVLSITAFQLNAQRWDSQILIILEFGDPKRDKKVADKLERANIIVDIVVRARVSESY